MKRSVWWAIGAVVGLSMAGVANAQEKKGAPAAAAPAGGSAKEKEKFYNFDDLLIDGEYKKPNALLFTGRDKVKFDRLLKLRKSFVPVILTSDKERALR
jgi:hypothetical protein